jgi:hypothetical protein
MAPKHHARPAATRGSTSARLWQDLRQYARLARSEGVSVERRPDGGILISPLPLTDSTNAAGNPQREREKKTKKAPDATGAEPMDTSGPPQPSKKQQRDVERAKKHQALPTSPSTARWTLLAQRLVRDARRLTRDSTHAAWKRSRTPEAQLEARRKWRTLLWREWTRPRFAPPPMPVLPAGCIRIPTGVQVLGARSLRDEYLLSRARALSRAAGISVSYDIARWLRQPRLRQAPSNRIAGAKTSPETAGLSTPVSSRSRKKKSRGGIGGQAT